VPSQLPEPAESADRCEGTGFAEKRSRAIGAMMIVPYRPTLVIPVVVEPQMQHHGVIGTDVALRRRPLPLRPNIHDTRFRRNTDEP
jgi:hypothetical protein